MLTSQRAPFFASSMVEPETPLDFSEASSPLARAPQGMYRTSSATSSTRGLSSTVPSFGVTLGGRNVYFKHSEGGGESSLSATRVLGLERTKYESFAAAQVLLTALPSDLPALVALQHRYREDFGRVGGAEVAARAGILQRFYESKAEIEVFEKCKVREEMAAVRHQMAARDALLRKTSVNQQRLNSDEQRTRVAVVISEERTRACIARWLKVEGEAIGLRERMSALQTLQERRRRVSIEEPERRQWDAIIRLIEETGLARISINPFGPCPFRKPTTTAAAEASPHRGCCPFSSPRGCHGLPIHPEHFLAVAASSPHRHAAAPVQSRVRSLPPI